VKLVLSHCAKEVAAVIKKSITQAKADFALLVKKTFLESDDSFCCSFVV